MLIIIAKILFIDFTFHFLVSKLKVIYLHATTRWQNLHIKACISGVMQLSNALPYIRTRQGALCSASPRVELP